MQKIINDLIEKYELSPHPEGGYFKRIWTSGFIAPAEILPDNMTADHSFASAIMYLLTFDSVSKLHVLKSDELWHFYLGSPILLHCFHPNKGYYTQTLGSNFLTEQLFQVIIEAGTVFGAELIDKGAFALVGCTVCPGFAWEDFAFANRDELISRYPEQREIIERTS